MQENAPHLPPTNKAEELELQDYQAITPEQEEVMARIIDIDTKLRTLDIIRNSVSKEYRRDKDSFQVPSLYTQEDTIREVESKLEEAYVSGSDVGELKDELAALRAAQVESAEFYQNHGNSMFNDSRSGREENRLRDRTEDQYSEEIQVLITTLEELGLPREQFIEAVNEGTSYDGIREQWRVSAVLDRFRSELMLQRNTERLALPGGVVEMSAELTKSVGADKVDYKELLYPHGVHRGQFAGEQVSVNQIFEALPFKEERIFSEYPTEVQERFFTSAAKRVFAATGEEPAYDMERKAASLGKDLSEIRIYKAERFRQAEDITFDIETTEKVLEFLQAEEEYLRTCLKADKRFTLDEKGLNNLGWRYDPDNPEDSEKYGLTWPVPDYEIKAEEERIKYAGNISSRSYAHTDQWRNAMNETLGTLKAENPYKSRGIDPLDIIIALRKTKDKIQVELETAQLEKEQLEMHNQYLQNLKGKQLSLAR